MLEFTDLLKAAQWLIQRSRSDEDLRWAIAGMCQREGVRDIAEFAEKFPERTVDLAESWADVDEQIPPGLT